MKTLQSFMMACSMLCMFLSDDVGSKCRVDSMHPPEQLTAFLCAVIFRRSHGNFGYGQDDSRPQRHGVILSGK